MTEIKLGPLMAGPLYGWGAQQTVYPVYRQLWGCRPVATMIEHPDVYYRHKTTTNNRGDECTTFRPATPEGEARRAEVEAKSLELAKLFAASPELLEAAIALKSWIAQGDFSRLPIRELTDMREDVQKAETAISKASG